MLTKAQKQERVDSLRREISQLQTKAKTTWNRELGANCAAEAKTLRNDREILEAELRQESIKVGTV